ncbi:MAG: hypothetical protein K6T83_08555 [Alicyclobacillus sp.]|nr:hypothetical protein [Alicyclobacillus sp.]
MKKTAGYVVAFIAGTLSAGTVAYAGSQYVQATAGTSTITINGKPVANPPKLVYGGTTYIQLYSIELALRQAGIIPTWNGTTSTLDITTPSNNSGSDSATVPVSTLPYSFKSGNGMILTINKISSASTSLDLNVTLTNDGSSTGDGSTLLMSNVTSGDSTLTVTNIAQIFMQTAHALYPQQSISGNIKYQPLPSGATVFTLNFTLSGKSSNDDAITFDLSK